MKSKLIKVLEEELLKPNKMTLTSFCKEVDVSPAAISKALRGQASIPLKLFPVLAAITSKPIEEWAELYKQDIIDLAKEQASHHEKRLFIRFDKNNILKKENSFLKPGLKSWPI